MIQWNSDLFKIQARGYQVTFETGVSLTCEEGGMAKPSIIKSQMLADIKATVFMDDCNGDLWLDFYVNTLKNGSKPFQVNLDLGLGVMQYEATLKPAKIQIKQLGGFTSVQCNFLVNLPSSGIDDVIFPEQLKVLKSGYNVTFNQSNVVSVSKGGIASTASDLDNPPIEYDASLALNAGRKEAFFNFFYNGIAAGAYSFLMNLDSGAGLETQTCILRTVTLSTSDGVDWSVKMKLQGERLPTNLPYCGVIVPLLNCYTTDELSDVLTTLYELTDTTMPQYILASDYE